VPGSGKSTLIALLCRKIREGGRKVGVVAVDPTSPFSGGSILGDRVRMSDLNADPGGVHPLDGDTRARSAGCRAPPCPRSRSSTRRATTSSSSRRSASGQDEVDVVKAAHTTVVVSAPGLGDDIQAIKAGVLEIADIHVVSKCDRSDANRTISELKSMLTMGLELSGKADWRVPVIGTSAVSGEGIDELLSPRSTATWPGCARAESLSATPPHRRDASAQMRRGHPARPLRAPTARAGSMRSPIRSRGANWRPRRAHAGC
jgi:LAO/AO transport system kinase